MKKLVLILLFSCYSISQLQAQVNEGRLGAWYMYFFDTTFKESKFGLQGDVQYRNWDLGGDLEQLLLRTGFTFKPQNTNLKITLGYGHITTGAYGDSNNTTSESRIYQEAIYPVKFGKRILTKHRFRYEQRFVENQDFRTRYRYNLFLNIPFNKTEITKGTIYAAFYNELFINGQRDIGDGNKVEYFDRNRFYYGVGYGVSEKMNIQFGFMNQTTNSWSKNQLQFSLHHKI